MSINLNPQAQVRTAVLDDAHIGDIRGAFGTILRDDIGPRGGLKHQLQTLLAVLGPGLIVMVGDNDAGAFGTYTQAGQNYGTTLLWSLLLLVPVLFVNQEMVLRLGVVTGVGHARLILARFGRFWGAFSVIDLFALNALTIVTEFIGIALALDYLGVPRIAGVAVSAALIMAAVSTGDFRRFERFAMTLVFASLLLIPIYVMVHPPFRQIAHDLIIPHLPHSGELSEVMLLIIAVVGTTIAPWQLFFQQSYVIDKRITPRFMRYELLDLWIGIALVTIGAVAMMAFTAATFAGRPEFGLFADAGHVALGLEKYAGKLAGVMFAVALIDAALIGAAAVSLSTAYAIGDVLSMRHSLHRPVGEAKGFYAIYFVLIAVAAAIVLTPDAPLGLLTNAVQTLAGVLLPSATVFLLLLCNDEAVLGPWVNPGWLNYFTGTVIVVLVTLSVILTASVLFPSATGTGLIMGILAMGGAAGAAVCILAAVFSRSPASPKVNFDYGSRERWRMPPLRELASPRLSVANRLCMGALRIYLVVAAGLVLFRIISLAFLRT
jgi:NRAMP (natural resistance-associated macrophage protein)-like metal ion transporter